MIYSYNGCKVYYAFHGKGEGRIVLLLHGWGASGEVFQPLIEAFPERRFLCIDFPPFGKSGEPQDWTIFSYASMVMSLCEHLGIETCDILAHSFGGRVAILLCALKCSLVHSCILTGSAGMKPRRTLSYHIKVLKYKIRKKFHQDVSSFGSDDFKNLSNSPQMKNTFISIVSTYLEQYCQKMPQKTLLVWGNDDKETPLYMAKRLNKKIKFSSLKILPGGHYVFLDSPLAFYKTINQFWEEV